VKKILSLTPFIGLFCFIAPLKAQINSPFSRFGVGNEIYNNQNAANQAMGGLTALVCHLVKQKRLDLHLG